MYKTTFHSAIERQDRVLYIATHMGFGSVMYERYNPLNDTIQQVTSTGIIIIVSAKDRKTVVTMYVANMKQAVEIAGTENIAISLRRTVERNTKNREGEKSNRFRY